MSTFSNGTNRIRQLLAAGSAYLAAVVALAGLGFAGEVIDPARGTADEEKKILWYDLQLLDVEGQGFDDTAAPYDRLPADAEKQVRGAVWSLSRHSAGLCARFITDAPTIHARWTLTSSRLEMVHMPATGVSGLDLYVKLDNGKWRWLAVGRPTGQTTTAQLVTGLPAGTREYMLYLPLYNGVSSVEIGLPKDAKLQRAAPRGPGERKPIVFYGTSITQGGCASRPGMVHTAIVGRKLNYPVINLGFSGNGRLEMEVAEYMVQLDPSVFVLDCLPNLNAPDVAARTEPFVRRLREAHPETPILLVEDRSYADAFLLSAKRARNEESRAAFRAAHERLQAAGVKNLYYLSGDKLLGEDGEDTVDSSHPTDLGFMRQAEAFVEALQPLLKTGGGE